MNWWVSRCEDQQRCAGRRGLPAVRRWPPNRASASTTGGLHARLHSSALSEGPVPHPHAPRPLRGQQQAEEQKLVRGACQLPEGVLTEACPALQDQERWVKCSSF